jgi:hypothetical protein
MRLRPSRLLVVGVLASAFLVTSAIAGAAGPGRVPVPYAPGSEYVYSGAGLKIGTLTGRDLGLQFNTVRHQVSR